ncbi:RNA chaperone Hfq [Candidatus Sumerlaeota bacterium]|nr:RNA chaperone Hfq [Candidatus Sumerlaeota bacterium]
MAGPNVNLQDSFLNHVRKENIEVEIMLCNGTALRGNVRGFDNFTVIIQANGKQHLIYKHAIAQLIAPKFSRSAQPPAKENGSKPDETHRRQGGRGKETAKPAPPKFNALDLSAVQVDQEAASGPAEVAAEVAAEPPSTEKP